MSFRYMSERYPDQRDLLSAPSFHGESNLARSRRSPYFSNEMSLNPDNSYYREGRHISDHQIRERSRSPRDRSSLSLGRSQEPDLREYLIAAQYQRKLLDYDRDGPKYSRSYIDDRIKYDRDIDLKARFDHETMDLRNQELLSRRDFRDEKYLLDSERDRRFSDLRDELYDRKARYSPDRRDQVYLSDTRREDPIDYRDRMYLVDSRRDENSSDFREADLRDFRRGWPSPDGRHKESSDSARWPDRDQHFRGIERDRRCPDQSYSYAERDWRLPDQNHSYAPERDLRSSDPRYLDSSTERWRDQYPEQRYGRDFIDTHRMAPINDDRSRNEFNVQGRIMDYPIEDNWKNGNPSRWDNEESLSNIDIEEEERGLASFPPGNNITPYTGSLNTPFATGNALPRIEMEGAPLPKNTVLVQYLYNFNQPLTLGHAQYVKKVITRYWNEERMKKREGLWLPRFLECIRRHNGLAIVCADRRSFRWLLNKKIKGFKSFFFVSTDAATPIKKLKLCFQVPDEGLTANEALRKIHGYNRGHQINFDRFRVLSSKRNGGNLFIIVLADTWSANRIKKRLNWRPLYGNKRVLINVFGKKKKKPVPKQPGEVKEPDIETEKFLNELKEMDEDTFSESYDEL